MDEQCGEKNQFNNHLLFHMKDIVKNQFNNHLLVEMVLRVDEFFIMRSFAFLVGYIFFNVMLHYVREIQFLRNVDDGKKGEAR